MSRLLLLCVVFFAFGAVADDGTCVRNNCLGTCITKQEALGKAVPMLCKSTYSCYQDIECAKLDDGTCGWKETPAFKACLTEKNKPAL